jgi:hypothetical protein
MEILFQAQSMETGGQAENASAMYDLFSLFGGIEFALRAIAFCDEVEGVMQISHPPAERRFICLENFIKSKQTHFIPGWDYWEWRKPFLVAWEVLLKDYREHPPADFGPKPAAFD